jgi:hypothetical protein
MCCYQKSAPSGVGFFFCQKLWFSIFNVKNGSSVVLIKPLDSVVYVKMAIELDKTHLEVTHTEVKYSEVTYTGAG